MKTPQQFDELDQALDFDADSGRESSSQRDSANGTCVRTRDSISGLCAALVIGALAAAVPQKAEALPPFEHTRDHSGIIDIGTLSVLKSTPKPDIGELSKIPWNDVAIRLSGMETNDILDLMAEMLPVLDDIKRVSHEDINKKLRDEKLRTAQPNAKILEESEKDLFLEMTGKYCPEDLDAVSSILKKGNLSERDCHFLFLTFKKFVAGQKKTLSLYINTREWISQERGKDLGSNRLAYLKQLLILLNGFEKNLSF
jgi:hypothetical protein